VRRPRRTFEVGVADARAEPADCARILAANRRFFADRAGKE